MEIRVYKRFCWISDIVVIFIVMEVVGMGIKLLDNKINYFNLIYNEYKVLKEYKYKLILGEIIFKYEDIRIGCYVIFIGDNIKEVRKYLIDMGLNFKKIDKIVDLFVL